MDNEKLTAILLNLHKSRRSGILRIERKMEKKQLIFSEGRLAFAESSLPDERLVKFMAVQGGISALKLREVNFAIKKGKNLEEALLETSGIKTQDVADGVAEQAIAILASLWQWSDCVMNFYSGENYISRRIKADISLPDAIISSARYAVTKRLFLAPSGFLEGRFAAVETRTAGMGEIPFNDAETAMLVNLRKPLRTIDLITLATQQSGNPEEAILSLTAIGLIRFQSLDEILQSSSDPDAMVLALENTLRRINTAGHHYEVLSVLRSVSPNALQDAYYRMARQIHPDRFQSKDFDEETRLKAQKTFAAVNEAYLVLKDPVTRKAYDDQLDEDRYGRPEIYTIH